MDFEKCSQKTKGARVVVQENRSKFEVLNPGGIEMTKVQVDGCLITDHRERCDWVLSLEKPIKKAMFVELKGKDVLKAISQLKSTLGLTQSKYHNYQRECYVVTTRVPKDGSEIRRRRIDLKKKMNSTLSIKNVKATVSI